MTRATVLIPTHDHGRTLWYAAKSVLAQSVEDLELFIVGDGVGDETREVVAELGRGEPRVRFFDRPKGPRHGEIHRHAALDAARGEIVCYLSDDDLWLPDHVATLEEQLAETDFTHTLSLWVDADGTLKAGITRDLAAPRVRREVLEGRKADISLSCAGHTLALYRRLPHGWRTTPAGIPTDVYMWQQILAVEGCRAGFGARPTCLRFPSPRRSGWPIELRTEELERWWKRIQDPAWRAGFEREVAEVLVRDHAARRLELRTLRAEQERLEAALQRYREASLLSLARERLAHSRVARTLRRWAGGARGDRGAR